MCALRTDELAQVAVDPGNGRRRPAGDLILDAGARLPKAASPIRETHNSPSPPSIGRQYLTFYARPKTSVSSFKRSLISTVNALFLYRQRQFPLGLAGRFMRASLP